MSAVGDLWAQDLVINEIGAVGSDDFLDEDGEPSDWLEIYNAGTTIVDMDGWFLTDDALNINKWSFPSVILEPGDFLIVFASGKDRSVAGEELHTNFNLSRNGEYLGLIYSDGTTVIHQYTPEYPRQVEDISYGVASTELTTLIGDLDTVDYHLPTDNGLGGSWTELNFTPDGRWVQNAAKPLGYSVSDGGGAFPPPVSYFSFNGTIQDQAGNNHGSYSGGSPNYVQGFNGQSQGAIDFSGSDYVTLDQNTSLPIYSEPAYTIAMWVKGMPQNDKRVYSEGSSSSNTPLFNIGTDNNGSTGKVDLFIRSSGGTPLSHVKSDGIAFDGNWHHIAWVDVDGQAKLYIDGELDGQNFNYSKPDMNLDISAIGAVVRAGPCCEFDGSIDEVGIWDVALTPEEISVLADGQPPGEGSLFSGIVETDLEQDMKDSHSSIYVRIPFDVEDPAAFSNLSARVRYDDGFAMFLNGVEVASRNDPPVLNWNSVSTEERADSEAIDFEDINITQHLNVLVAGENVLAIQGLNLTADDADFLLDVQLLASGQFGTELRFFEQPTPGQVNQGGFVDFVADTKFTIDRGWFDAPFDVEISTETPGAEIRYTTDGTAPSSTHGQVYDGPITIDTTTTLRAIAHRNGFVPTNVDTQTYIFLDDVIRQPKSPPPGYPATWQGFMADYGMDPEICLDDTEPHYEPGIKDDLLALPTLSIVLAPDDLMGSSRGIYTHSQRRGRSWERACSVELMYPDGSEPGFQVNGGVRMQGNSSARPGEGKHTFRLVFRDEYGPKKLRYPLYKDSDVDSFDTLSVRCFSTDSWHFKDGGSRYRRWDSQFIRDLWMRDSQIAMGQPGSHSIYVHLYVNGMYWGLYNPSERPDDEFGSDHLGGEPEDWDIYKDFTELFRGNSTAWNQLMSMASAGFSSQTSYQRAQGNNPDGTRNPAFPVLLDVDNLIEYMLLHFYGGSEDWPHHNYFAGRLRTDDSTGWKWFVWDQEIVLDWNYRDRLNVTNTGPASVYAAAKQNLEFRTRFGDLAYKHLYNGGLLTNEETQARWMRRANEIDRAIVGESARWGDYRTEVSDPRNSPAVLYTREGHWLVEQEKVMNTYLPQSRTLLIQRLKRDNLLPDVEAPAFNQHGGRIASGFELELTAPEGEIYYTFDGEDPRLEGGEVSPNALSLGPTQTELIVAEGANARILVPTSAHSGIEETWMLPEFNDGAWDEGSSSVGYDRNTTYDDHIDTDLRAEMDGENATVWIRIPFNIDDPARFNSLVLKMKYDDGFYAYLNGEFLESRNAPDSLDWNAEADGSHSDTLAVEFESLFIENAHQHLRAGENILAIHGMNVIPGSSDFLIASELLGGVASEGENSLVLEESTLVSARARTGNDWSALNQSVFIVDQGLRVTEINFHPQGPFDGFSESSYEFLELQNFSDQPIDLTNYRLAGGVGFDFSQGAVTTLGPGEIIIVCENVDAFDQRYGNPSITVAGQYTGKLNNSGDNIQLVGIYDEVYLDINYGDQWYPEADGEGGTLILVDAETDVDLMSEPSTWGLSNLEDGSPGIDETSVILDNLQRPGDANQDGMLDIGDAVSLLVQLYVGGVPAPCDGANVNDGSNVPLLDGNNDGIVNQSDVIYTLTYLYLGGPVHTLGASCAIIEGCPSICR